ncbi:MAG: HAD family phosphatase [Ruminococcaceae bacterium]|nr:HAD family phosphatase [Oscillospiraceae bacterium]
MMKGAIFDLDGTILDSMFIWDTIGEDYLRFLGKEPKKNLKETFKTFTLEQAALYYRENYGVTLSVDEIADSVNKMVKRYYAETVPLKPGMEVFLEKLKAKGVKMCIATVTDKHLVESALGRLGVRYYFSEIFTCASVGHSKEEPYIYREAQKHLNTEKGETAVFEDALHALKTAKTDGFVAVGVFDVHEENQEELKRMADCYIEDYSEFDKFWGSINK